MFRKWWKKTDKGLESLNTRLDNLEIKTNRLLRLSADMRLGQGELDLLLNDVKQKMDKLLTFDEIEKKMIWQDINALSNYYDKLASSSDTMSEKVDKIMEKVRPETLKPKPKPRPKIRTRTRSVRDEFGDILNNEYTEEVYKSYCRIVHTDAIRDINYMLNECTAKVLKSLEIKELFAPILEKIYKQIPIDKSRMCAYLRYFVLSGRLELSGHAERIRYTVNKDNTIPKRKDDVFLEKLGGNFGWKN